MATKNKMRLLIDIAVPEVCNVAFEDVQNTKIIKWKFQECGT